MEPSFRFLRVAVGIFKVVAWFVLILMLVGVVGLYVGSDAKNPVPASVVLNMIFSGLLGFLTFFTLAEMIRLLLTIRSNTRKS